MRPARGALLSSLFLALAQAAQPAEWVEVQSPNFRVVSDAGVKLARGVAGELERIRLVFQNALVPMEQDPGLPIVVFAVKNEKGLQELLPEYWEREAAKPAGVFLRGSDTHYVVVRVDARPEQRYPLIYHEYFHLLLSLNIRIVPVWLNEGLAEFWEQTRFRGRTVQMGFPNESHLYLLGSQRLLPLGELVSMEQNPHLSDPNRVSIFYAQSWALTHFLMLGGPEGSPNMIGTYLELVDEGTDPTDAFTKAFGPLELVQKQLERYIRSRLLVLQMEAPKKIDEDTFSVRDLSDAASAAERGRFLVSGTRPEASLPLLERALAVAPDDALALEGMGFYHFRRDEHDEAKQWFSRAVSVDSKSFLCHYYLARLLMLEGDAGEEQAKESLHRTIELNPKFAPAYADLGQLFAVTGVRLESARGMAFKAVQLEPDNAWYWVNLGRILLAMDQREEAVAAAERARGLARSDGTIQMVDRFQLELDADRKLAVQANHHVKIEGRFVELRCHTGGETLDFVVESDGRTLVFRTDSPGAIQILENGESVTRAMDCGPQDAPVAVTYTPDAGTNVAGELRVLEFLR